MSDLMIQVCRCLVLDRKDRYLRHAPSIEKLISDFQMFCLAAMKSPSQVHRLFSDWYLSNRLLKIRGFELEIICQQAAKVIKESNVDFFD
jgi:hypothetical protein